MCGKWTRTSTIQQPAGLHTSRFPMLLLELSKGFLCTSVYYCFLGEAMNAKHLLRFMKKKLKRFSEDIVDASRKRRVGFETHSACDHCMRYNCMLSASTLQAATDHDELCLLYEFD